MQKKPSLCTSNVFDISLRGIEDDIPLLQNTQKQQGPWWLHGNQMHFLQKQLLLKVLFISITVLAEYFVKDLISLIISVDLLIWWEFSMVLTRNVISDAL